jgi:hypothetical protein
MRDPKELNLYPNLDLNNPMQSSLFPRNYIEPGVMLEIPGLEKLIRASYPGMITNAKYLDSLWNLLLAYRAYQKAECSLQIATQLGLIYFGACNKIQPERFDLKFTNQQLLITYLKLEGWYDSTSVIRKPEALSRLFVKRGNKRIFIQRFWLHASDTVIDSTLRKGATLKNFEREKSRATKYLVELLGSKELNALDLIIGSVKT